MATIEPIKRTIVQEQFVLTLERAELEDIVRDPRPWVNEWRSVLKGTLEARPKARRNGHVAARKNGRAKKATKSRSSTGGDYECRNCHRKFKREGNRDNHQAGCEVEIGTFEPSAD